MIRPLGALVLALTATATARVLYFDAQDAKNPQTGLSPALAWKPLAKANGFNYLPGDSLLFRRGTIYTGQFAPENDSRTTAAPAFVDSFGRSIGRFRFQEAAS